MKNYILAIIVCTIGVSSFSQITINTTPTAAQLVMNTLVGPGVAVSNITYTGDPSQKGYFNGSTNCNIGLPEGVLLSTGRVIDCIPPAQPNNIAGQLGNPGDNDLLTIAQSVASNPDAATISSTNDAAILEFDFVPSGNLVSFNFVFSSEEYLTYVNSEFNDAFGFFVSGPGIVGPYASPAAFPNGSVNLAVVPGTSDPITISTIYPGLNASYYIGSPIGHSFNGFTVPIEITFSVDCGETYHFKFAVADCQDDYLDTGVFLEAGSFTSNSISLDSQSSASGLFTDTLLAENCVSNLLSFTRPIDQVGVADTIPLYFSGTLDVYTDLASFVDTIFFAPTDTTVTFLFDPIDDGLLEGQEFVEIGYYNITACGDSIYDSLILYVVDTYPLTFDIQDTLVARCLESLNQIEILNFTNSIPPYTVNWDFGSNFNPAPLPVLASNPDTAKYYATITDGCGDLFYDSLVYIMNQTISIDSILMSPATCEPIGTTHAYISGLTNPANVTYEWINSLDTTIVFPNQDSLLNLGGTWYILTITDNNIPCSVTDSVFVTTIDTPMAIASVNSNYGCSPLTATFANNSSNSNSYIWDFGDGTIVNSTTTDNQTHTFYGSSIVTLTASNGNTNCDNIAVIPIQIIECGCTDPNGINYNPNAIQSDGSCIYPIPTVKAPNVITANGDNINGFFFLQTTYAESIEFTILNRWGNEIYSAQGDQTHQPSWNGENKNGALVQDGVYFYRYKVLGIQGHEVEGHGFVEVVR